MSTNPPEAGTGIHQHPYDEWHNFIEGQWECRVGDEIRILGPGIGRQVGVTSPPGCSRRSIARLLTPRWTAEGQVIELPTNCGQVWCRVRFSVRMTLGCADRLNGKRSRCPISSE